MTRTSWIAWIASALVLTSCQWKVCTQCRRPPVEVPDCYLQSSGGAYVPGPWWQEYGDGLLNVWVERALEGNLDLAQSWSRLRQARAQACIAGAALYPEVNVGAAVNRTDVIKQGQVAFGGFGGGGAAAAGGNFTSGDFVRYSLTPRLAYEVDLWRRIDHTAQAALRRAQASCETYLATALTLSGTVTDTWFTLLEQKALEELIQEQIETSITLLDLVELRFAMGEASALDVYQQRQQLASARSQVPPVLSQKNRSMHQLLVLTGQAPAQLCIPSWIEFPRLPAFPFLGSPCQLLCNRPDLRASYQELRAADEEVAAAVADLFPKLTIDFNYEFSGLELHRIFERQVSTLIANLVQPIIDGGRRICEVQRNRALLCERLQAFGQTFLTALLEVEDAVVAEQYQKELIQRLEEERTQAEGNLEVARWRYSHGLNDFLPVLTAVQTLQNLQRRLISEKKNLLSIRAQLYRALGG